MKNIKEHIIIFLIVTFFIHIITCYIFGTFDTMGLSQEVRECQLLVFIAAQFYAHYFWINRNK
jgi:hypothetical protein